MIDVDSTRQRQRQQRGRSRPAGAELDVDLRGDARFRGELELRVLAPVPCDVSRHVVIRQHPRRGRAYRGVHRERRVDAGTKPLRLPWTGKELEVERGVHFVGPQIEREALRVLEPDLTDEDSLAGVRACESAPGAIDVVQLASVREGMRRWSAVGVEVWQSPVFEEQRGRVDSHPRHATVEPEAQDVLVLSADVVVLPVEVGLLGREEMQIPLIRRAVFVVRPRPGAAAEDGQPVVRRELAM